MKLSDIPRSEKEVHRKIITWLPRALPGAVIHHSPNEVNQSGKAAMIMVAEAKEMGMRVGWPDIEILWCGQFWTLEVKKPGSYPTKKQRECGDDIKRMGGKWACVHSIYEAEKVILRWTVEAVGNKDELTPPVGFVEMKGKIS